MKNKFKKSKIIVPALALITATTVASVTGTVAWFTANRTATLTASEFQAKALNSTLKIKAEAVNACTVTTGSSGDSDSATIKVSGPLTHASFDADTNENKNVYTALAGDNEVTGYKSLGAYTETASSTTNTAGTSGSDSVYYVVSWKLTFTQTLSSNSESLAVLFNPAASFYSDATKVNAGFRTAMYTNNRLIVFGNDGVKTHVKSEGNGNVVYTNTTDTDIKTGKTYYTKKNDTPTYEIVNNPSKDSLSTYYEKTIDRSAMEESFQDNVYMQHQASYQTLNDEADTLISADEYLGTINNNNSSLTVNCVSWYEGTDSAVVTDNVTDTKIASNLSFYSRRIKSQD